MFMRKVRSIVSLLLLVGFAGLILGGCATGATAPAPDSEATELAPLRVGLIPNVAPEEQKAKYEPLRVYLEETLERPVELFVASNYTGVVQAMVSGHLDMAYFGGVTYAQALQQVELEPILTEIDAQTGTQYYYSAIIAGVDSGVETLDDLAGKDFAFGDPASTSGTLYPRVMLYEAGFDWRNDFQPIANVIYSGGHDATAKAVENGTVAAGGIEERILNRMIDDGRVDGSRIKVIERILVQGYPWCVVSSMDPELKDQIQHAFMDITDPQLLDLLRARAYVKVGPEDYADLLEDAIKFDMVDPAN